MKTLKYLFANVLVLFVFAVPALALTGSGNPAIDVPALQGAVDAGGLVQLDGTFHLGNDALPYMADDPTTPYRDERYGSISITTDVTIEGSGTPKAKIIGGEFPIYCDEPKNLTVKDTIFEDSKNIAISVSKSTRVEITGCEILNIKKGVPTPPYPPFTRAYGISLSTNFSPGDIIGDVIISNNTINPNVYLDDDYRATYQAGIVLSYTDSNAQITGNHIYNCNLSGIAINGNPGEVNIADNKVHTGPAMPDDDVNYYSAGYTAGNGINVGYTSGYFSTGSSSVTSNEVICVNPMADGIIYSTPFLPNATHVISGNTVTMGTSDEACEFGALRCWGGVYNSVWEENTVEGYMDFSMAITGGKCENNEFRDNILGGSNVSLAHIYMERGATQNRSINNDFTSSSVPGWHLGGPGCVLLGAGANKNFVNETLFPGDDGVCEQVLGIEGNIVENEVGGYNPGMCNAYNNMYENAEAIVLQKMLEMQERRARKYLQF